MIRRLAEYLSGTMDEEFRLRFTRNMAAMFQNLSSVSFQFVILNPNQIGHLLTSSNYDDKQKKVTGGRNGYGAKLTNIFSKKFTVETLDSKRKKSYSQTFLKNLTVIEPPVIKAISGDELDFTQVTFEPDLKKFKMSSLDDDTVALLSKRVYDLAGCTPASVSVHLNGKKIAKVTNFETYTDLYFKKDNVEKFYEKCGDRWEICVAVLPD